jgi:hypothetical protein
MFLMSEVPLYMVSPSRPNTSKAEWQVLEHRFTALDIEHKPRPESEVDCLIYHKTRPASLNLRGGWVRQEEMREGMTGAMKLLRDGDFAGALEETTRLDSQRPSGARDFHRGVCNRYLMLVVAGTAEAMRTHEHMSPSEEEGQDREEARERREDNGENDSLATAIEALEVAHEASDCACAIQDDGQLGVTRHTSDTEHLPKALTSLIEALQSITTRQMAQLTGSWADPAPEPEDKSSDEEAP